MKTRLIKVTEEVHIRECPHCGNLDGLDLVSYAEMQRVLEVPEDYRDDTDEGAYILCNYNKRGCGATSGYGASQLKAIEKWNTRHG